MINTVIFDMDGVIVDSELYWKTADIDLIRSFIPEWNNDYENKIVGLSLPDLYNFLKTNFNTNMPYGEFKNFYNDLAIEIYKNKTNLLPHFMNFIKDLRKEKFKTAIASSSPPSWIKIVVDRFNLSGFFDKTFSVEEIKCKGKPHPDIYLYAARSLGRDAEQCVVIEDSRNGVQAAKSAGMKCIGLRNGFNHEQDLSKADIVINNFSELSAGKIRKM